MDYELIDLNAMKYRKICCPYCGKHKHIEINNAFEDEYEEKVVEYICNNCDEIFVLSIEDRTYEEGSIDEDEWHELTEDHKCMLGIDE